jgi:hypothetical protein
MNPSENPPDKDPHSSPDDTVPRYEAWTEKPGDITDEDMDEQLSDPEQGPEIEVTVGQVLNLALKDGYITPEEVTEFDNVSALLVEVAVRIRRAGGEPIEVFRDWRIADSPEVFRNWRIESPGETE